MRTLFIIIYLTIIIVSLVRFIKESKINLDKKSNMVMIVLAIILLTICFYLPFLNPINKNTRIIGATKCCLIDEGGIIKIEYESINLDEICEESLISLLTKSFSIRREMTKEGIDVQHYDIHARKHEYNYAIFIFRDMLNNKPGIKCIRFLNGVENAEWIIIPTEKDYEKIVSILDSRLEITVDSNGNTTWKASQPEP